MAYNSKSQLTKELSRQNSKARFHLPTKARETCFLADREAGREGGREGQKQAGRAPYELLAGWQTGLCSSGFNGSGPLV